MATSYKNIPVTVSGQTILANNVSLDQNISITPVRALGRSNGLPIQNEPPQTTIAVDFYIQEAAAYTVFRDMRSGNGTFSVEVGGTTLDDCLLSSFSIAAQSNQVITASANMFTRKAPAITAGSSSSFGAAELAHGATSTGAVASNSEGFSFNYEMSKEYTNTPVLGKFSPGTYTFSAGSESISMEGSDLPTAAGTGACNSDATAGINIKGICDSDYGTIGVTGAVTAANVSVSEGDVVRGTTTITRYF